VTPGTNRIEQPEAGWLRERGNEMSHRMNRRHYADMFGPTTGDKVRLGDTSLVLEVEKDHTVYGDECKFGGGKVIREGMGQAAGVGRTWRSIASSRTRSSSIHRNLQSRHRNQERADSRHWQSGQSRRDGRRHAEHDRWRHDGGHRGRGTHLTAGGLDTHIHFICPQQAHEAIAAGLTTMIGGGTGPAVGTCATTARRALLLLCDVAGGRSLPLNFRFHWKRQHGTACGSAGSNSRRGNWTEAPRRLGHDTGSD
jgi:hypothetical protein